MLAKNCTVTRLLKINGPKHRDLVPQAAYSCSRGVPGPSSLDDTFSLYLSATCTSGHTEAFRKCAPNDTKMPGHNLVLQHFATKLFASILSLRKAVGCERTAEFRGTTNAVIGWLILRIVMICVC